MAATMHCCCALSVAAALQNLFALSLPLLLKSFQRKSTVRLNAAQNPALSLAWTGAYAAAVPQGSAAPTHFNHFSTRLSSVSFVWVLGLSAPCDRVLSIRKWSRSQQPCMKLLASGQQSFPG